ncbi:3-oxoacyl-[acyl-carrier-protein] reductase FabG-like [Achroia grisella]|uniref:3-oxoacyl-[acyl-carrier-protein] reductase FabG-like n=1 Tax=Achroia grisella TaxID=688607 RepID=UPI0027D1F34E|nr:3-oxoacyl-[acyl-carrier-protein] reductase FabG-like [Achroia grisella]
MSFKNKIVIVTGAGSGIGAATAVQFAKEGAGVVLVDRDESRLKSVREQCTQTIIEPLLVTADVSKDEDAQKIIGETIKKFNKLDILVNCAGILRMGSVLDGSIMQTYNEIMNINLRSVVLLTTLAVPYLVKSKGNIVNVSSVNAVIVMNPENAAYAVSKAGLEHFTRGTALELAPSGVRVNAVRPGAVKTRIAEHLGRQMPRTGKININAFGRISEPEEIADTILFLANDKAKGITGSIYTVDNGMAYK